MCPGVWDDTVVTYLDTRASFASPIAPGGKGQERGVHNHAGRVISHARPSGYQLSRTSPTLVAPYRGLNHVSAKALAGRRIDGRTTCLSPAEHEAAIRCAGPPDTNQTFRPAQSTVLCGIGCRLVQGYPAPRLSSVTGRTANGHCECPDASPDCLLEPVGQSEFERRVIASIFANKFLARRSASRARTEICSSLRLRSVMCRAVLEVLMIFPAASFIGETVSEMCITWVIRMRRLAWRQMSRVTAEEFDHLVQREPTTHLS
jgi:hypothetical protein